MRTKVPYAQMLFLLAAVSLALTPMHRAAAAEPDLKAWAEAGAKSAERLKTSPASWRAVTTLSNGAAIEVVMLSAGQKLRADFTLIGDGKRLPNMKLISRDNLWYVTDAQGSFKYRPYEAPTETPLIYMALERSTPHFLGEGYLPAAEHFEKLEGDVALFRQPLPPHLVDQLKATVETEELLRQSGKPLPPDFQAQMNFSRELLAKGMVSRVNTATGQLIEFGSQQMRTRVEDFKFLDKANDLQFAGDGENWQDESDDPTAGDLNDLIMIGHQPNYRIGMKTTDTDGRLMDVKTGRFRRLPFPGPVRAGCFLPDRRFVIVSGADIRSGSLRPYRIDLKTGKCEALGSPRLDVGFSLFPDVSPDGKTAVVLHMNPQSGANPLESQVTLIDLVTGTAKPLGKRMDTAFLRWTADCKRLLLVSRHYKELNSPAITSLALMDLEGQVKELRRGEMPTLLADRQTILYLDPETDLWRTCDLEGKNDKLYADGLKRHKFPAPAPDGKRLLMMRYSTGKLPEPMVLPIGQSEGRAITHVGGAWIFPVW